MAKRWAFGCGRPKATQTVPLIFVEGSTEKVERVKRVLPDACFTTYRSLGAQLRKELSRTRSKPVVPKVNPAGYSGTPLAKKLGIKSDSTVHLIDAPQDFESLLSDLPTGVRLKRQLRGSVELAIWFVTSVAQLEKRIDTLAGRLGAGGGLWIAWPKKTSGMATDVTQNDVRRVGLASGLVDYKICAIDATLVRPKVCAACNVAAALARRVSVKFFKPPRNPFSGPGL